MTAPRRSATSRLTTLMATALLLAGLAFPPPAGAEDGAEDGAGPTVLASVVMAGGFCGAAAANMPPCRVPDAPAAHVALLFVPEGAGTGSDAAGATTATVDDAGFLAASLKPGTYAVQLAQPSLALRMAATTVVVTAGQITQLALRIEALRP